MEKLLVIADLENPAKAQDLLKHSTGNRDSKRCVAISRELLANRLP